MSQVRKIDPATFQVVMHRLWSINNEQGLICTKISGSQIITECYDFNTALMNKNGDTIFIGQYNTTLASPIDAGTKWIIEHADELGGIHDGDVICYNDPWIGCPHANDLVGITPVFLDDELICWLGLSMHEIDIGGVWFGSWGFGFPEAQAEGVIYTPIKLVEKGVFKPNIERLLLRNSRTVIVNQLNLRARLGAFNFAKKRIYETITRYGKDTVLAILEQIKDYVRGAVRAKLRELPDGSWSESLYWDHDSIENKLFEGRLTLTKKGDRMTLDFTGTSPQAKGFINCTRVGLHGDIAVALLPALFYDLPWTAGVIKDICDVVIDEGTIFTATYPTPVGGAPVQCGTLAANLIFSCLNKMLASSNKYVSRASAGWAPFNGQLMSGLQHTGLPLMGLMLDGMAGGAPAYSYRDGVDVAGLLVVLFMKLANVERYEERFPLLTLYRRRGPETCGHGRFRGGVGLETAYIPYKNPIPLREQVCSASHALPAASAGIMGGYPSSNNLQNIARKTNVMEFFAKKQIPVHIDELNWERFEALEAKADVFIDGTDVWHLVVGGGCGYGDPLDRDPEAVRRDVQDDIYSIGTAKNIYGCILDPETLEVDLMATEEQRQKIRAKRLEEGKLVSEIVKKD